VKVPAPPDHSAPLATVTDPFRITVGLFSHNVKVHTGVDRRCGE
jgi:hypothetical protein